jgi:hypothetical protein
MWAMRPSQLRHEVDVELVEYLVVVVPHEAAAEVVLTAAMELAEGGLVTIFDAAIVSHDERGATHFADPTAPSRRASDLPTRRGLLTDHDLELIALAVPEGNFGVVVVAEDTWAGPLALAARNVGGYVAGGERIPRDRIAAILQHPEKRPHVR